MRIICGNSSVVERHLAKVNVAGSNLVSRSKICTVFYLIFFAEETAGKWRYSQAVRPRSAKPLCPGSNPGGASKRTLHRIGAEFFFKKAYKNICRCGGIGRRKGLKIFQYPVPHENYAYLCKNFIVSAPAWRNRQTHRT